MKGASLGVLAAVALVVTGVVLAVGSFAFSWFTAPYQGKLQARQQINSGDFRIAAYNHFFDLCASVQTADQNIVVQEKLLAQFPKKDAADRTRVLTNIGGLMSARNDGVNQYNADAQKDYTVGQFKSSKLPWQLPATYKTGESITCAN